MSYEASKVRLIMALRQQGITDTNVLSAIERVPRERFVLPGFVDQAYDDAALPIDSGQTISQPYVVAVMTEALKLDPKRHKVLEIGTGSGYQAAVLARLARRVYTVERHRNLSKSALAALEALGLSNVTGKVGDGGLGWPEVGPFERILMTCATEEVPDRLFAQVAEGGILVAPVGPDGGTQHVLRYTRQPDGGFAVEDLLPVRFVPLLPGVPA